MRPAVLSIAILLGIANLGAATDVRATPTLSATIVIESGRTVAVGGKRHHHHGFQRGPAPHRNKGLAQHHKRWHDGRHHHSAFVTKRVYKAPVVIVQPVYPRSFGHRHLPARPLIRSGSFARGPYRW